MNQKPDEWSETVLRYVGKNLRRKRQDAGWTINRMYAETGIARVTIMRWESGERAPKIDDLLWVCKCTGWRLGDLLGGARNAAVNTGGRNAAS